MTTEVDTTIEVDVPVSTAYNQWTQFESFPQFMGGVSEVRQLDDRRLHWVAEIAGVRREWDAEIVDQVPDSKVAWVATEGATNAGAVYFVPLDAGRTSVRLRLEYEPEGVVEKAGDALSVVERQATSDLKKFKKLIEDKGWAEGGWRGGVASSTAGTPGVQDAAQTRGDVGKAGVSKTAVAAGVVAAAAAAGTAVASVKAATSSDDDEDFTQLPPRTVEPVTGPFTVPVDVDPLPAADVDPLAQRDAPA